MRVVADYPDAPDDVLCAVARDLLSATTRYNQWLLRSRALPPLYRSGVRFADEPWAASADGEGIEQLAHALAVIERGWGDCAPLSAWRAAELRNQGEPVDFHFSIRPMVDGAGRDVGREVHVMLRRKGGWIEDPSRLL